LNFFADELDSQGLEPMFQILRDIGMQVRPPLHIEPTQEPFNWVPIAVKTKRRVFQDLLIGLSVYPQNSNCTIQRLTLGTPDIRSPLPGYDNTIDLFIILKSSGRYAYTEILIFDFIHSC
jgi:hypothetical protein